MSLRSDPVDGSPSDAVPVDAAAVIVVYDPESNGRPDPGEVVWTWVPYEDDPRQGKDRPVVVIGRVGDGADADLAVLPLSSRSHEHRRDADGWVEVGRGAWDSGDRVSHADVDRLLRVPVGVVRREGATLDRRRFDAVVAAARRRHADLG